jgi:glucose-1-phosphate cytidylyltransferase
VKVVLFCGGLGLRMREDREAPPKPLVPLGGRPLLWHVMAYYARAGHTDFVLCLGYGAAAIRKAVLEDHASLFEGWRIQFSETSERSPVGARLRAAAPLLADEDVFLANYADCLTDASLPDMIGGFLSGDHVASFLCVPPTCTYHVASLEDDGSVTALRPAPDADVWVNGGYFVLGREIFDYLRRGEDLVEEPFARLISEGRLKAHRHTGFWAPVDTPYDRLRLDALLRRGPAPWETAALPAAATAAC